MNIDKSGIRIERSDHLPCFGSRMCDLNLEGVARQQIGNECCHQRFIFNDDDSSLPPPPREEPYPVITRKVTGPRID